MSKRYRKGAVLVQPAPKTVRAFPPNARTGRAYARFLADHGGGVLTPTETHWARSIVVMATAPCYFTCVWLSRRWADLLRTKGDV